jgi:hypothetical protein
VGSRRFTRTHQPSPVGSFFKSVAFAHHAVSKVCGGGFAFAILPSQYVEGVFVSQAQGFTPQQPL